MSNHCDIAIVGAGILGLAHAYAAARRGLKVRVFERSERALGASVRNFGMGLITGQAPGPMLELARASRPIWAGWAQAAGFAVKREGSLLFARTEAEERLLEAFCAGRAREHGYRVELLGREALGSIYAGRFRHHRAALHGFDDQQLYSREALPALAAWLAREHGVEFHFATLVRDVEPGLLHTTAGRFQAGQIVVCSGHDYLTLLAEQLRALEPQVCRLQMLRVAPQQALDLQHAVLTGLSGVHYGAFADLPEAEAVRAQIRRECPALERFGIHLLVSPTPSGELIIGDSHDYGQDASPFNAEEVDKLLQLAEHTLATPLRVIERWQGVYGGRGPAPFTVTKAAEGVTAVLMHTGLGMSVGPALGERTVAALLGEAAG